MIRGMQYYVEDEGSERTWAKECGWPLKNGKKKNGKRFCPRTSKNFKKKKEILNVVLLILASVHFSSVAQLGPILCDPMNCSMPGLAVHHQLSEFIQTHVHWIGDAIQPSHPLSFLLLLPSIFPSIRVFSHESALCIRWPKYWSFSFNISPSSEHPGLISFRMDVAVQVL